MPDDRRQSASAQMDFCDEVRRPDAHSSPEIPATVSWSKYKGPTFWSGRSDFSNLWQKSAILARPDRSSFVRLTAMAMGKKPAARQPSPMWVTTGDLPTNAGHPFFERLNRVLEDAGFDTFVEGLCAAFYAARMGRPSLRLAMIRFSGRFR